MIAFLSISLSLSLCCLRCIFAQPRLLGGTSEYASTVYTYVKLPFLCAQCVCKQKADMEIKVKSHAPCCKRQPVRANVCSNPHNLHRAGAFACSKAALEQSPFQLLGATPVELQINLALSSTRMTTAALKCN